jgi:hypothetical protein
MKLGQFTLHVTALAKGRFKANSGPHRTLPLWSLGAISEDWTLSLI